LTYTILLFSDRVYVYVVVVVVVVVVVFVVVVVVVVVVVFVVVFVAAVAWSPPLINHGIVLVLLFFHQSEHPVC
jgi:hypothetical protein